jgi:LuxR family transcriptional regulator, maltose regulon positive regulatory protein
MVEPPFAAPSEVASEQDVLLATKLHMPRPRPDLIPRPRLAERLDEGLARGLMLVCAPAGYGKTVLLADWARRGQPPVAWLSLDVGDNDPARFWRHGVAALDQVRRGLAERVGPLLGPPAPASYEGLVTALINELAAGPDADQALLVLDDYHLIDSGAVHASLGFLLEHRPPGLHLVLASRSDPPLALARLRGRGQLAELRAAELRFTADEAAALLRQGAGGSGVALPETAVMALAARTEGWAAGLQLAALSLRGQPDAAGFTAAFTGSHRYVLDFLAEEVLEHQSEQVRTFLLETSVLERLSGELCDAVTGRPGSQALLEQAERAGLFVIPLDEVRGWWRYHHLFADLLRARLRTEQPGRVPIVHRSAAAWYAERGLADDAIRHAVAAGEMTVAARLIEQHFDELFYLRGEGATIQRWISALPGDLIRTRPRLLLAQALLAFHSGRLDAVESLLDAAEQAYAGAAEEPFEPTAGPAGSMLVNVPALIAIRRSLLAQLRGDADDTAAFASRALAESREGEWLLSSTARRDLAVAEWLRGRLAEAERAFVSSTAGWQAAGQPALTAWHRVQLAQVQRALGRLDAAFQTYEQALRATAVPGRPPPPTAGLVYVGLAEVAYQRNELDSALRYVTEGIALERQFLPGTSPAPGLVTLAWIRLAAGDPAGAREAIGEAGHASPAAAGLLNPAPAQHARLLLAQGDVAAAARWTDESGLRVGDEPRYPREPGYLVLARVLLAQQRPAEALALLDRLYAAAVAQDRVGSVIEAGALRALALDTVKKHVSHLMGKLGAANRTEAVTRARELGLIP